MTKERTAGSGSRGLLAGLTAGFTALASLGASGAAGAATDFYKGETIIYIVATQAGGGYDVYGRLIAKHMEKQLPGARIVVKNVPGAGHIIGANQLYTAKKDGLTIGTFNTGLVYAQLLKRKGVQFDLAKMQFLGKAAADPRMIMVRANSDVRTIDDLKNSKQKVKFAVAGPGSASYNEIKMLIGALGLNIDVIPGYNGKEDEMALRRNEVTGAMGSLSSFDTFVKNGYGRFVLQIGGKKLADIKDVALASEAITQGDGKAVAALIGAQAELGRLTAAPPGVPADRMKVLRAAYKGALTSKEFLADANRIGRPIDPLFGEEVDARIKQALDQPPAMVALVKSVLEEKRKDSKLKVDGALLSVGAKGRTISFIGKDGKTVESKVSGSRTKITINGSAGDRKSLKKGMKCAITYDPAKDNEPSQLACM